MNKLVTWMIVCSGLGGILYGYDIGVISGALLFIKKSIPLTNTQVGLIVGAVLGGSLFGTLITGPLADRFGRRLMIIVACAVFVCGIFAITHSHNFIDLLIARLLLGVAVGIVSVAVPLYLSEIAPRNIRGRSVAIFQLFLTFGILLAYIIDLIFTRSGNWHAMFLVILLPTLILLLSMLKLPETPRWLLANQRKQQACAILAKIEPHSNIDEQVASIQSGLSQQQSGWRELWAKPYLFPLLLSVFIAACNQLTGINVIFQYAPIVLSKSGFDSKLVAMLGTVGIGLMNFVTTIIALFLIDTLGRRFLLLLGTAGLVVADIALALIASSGHGSATLSLVFLIVYTFSFAIGPGVVVWLAISELMPTKVRGKAVALCLFVNSLSATVLASSFMPLMDKLSLAGVYWFFGFCSLSYFLAVYWFLPETKGKSLEQIQQHFLKRQLTPTQQPVVSQS